MKSLIATNVGTVNVGTWVNICPKKSESVYPEIWGILKLSGLINQKIFETVLSKFSNSLKSKRFNSFMNRNQKKLLYHMGNIFVSL